jgi:hypothetical protein
VVSCNRVASLWKRTLAGALVSCFLAGLVPAPRVAAATTYVTDSVTHTPPATGATAYGTFNPSVAGFPAKGGSFVDPVFGSTIRRLTSEVGSSSWSDHYAKNGNMNADNTLVVHSTPGGRHFLNTTTGAIVRASVPGNDNSAFDPVNPDTWWWYGIGGSTLNKYSVASGTSTTVKNFGTAINNNGGSTDWIDASGRYMLLRLGSTWRVYDVQADVLYSGAIPESYGGTSGGWGGISPDGKYVITADSPGARSWPINHTAKTLSTTGNLFWSLCGDHGDVVSASNGKTYFITFECDTEAAIYAVDVSLPQTMADKNKQRADNRRLIDISWSDSGHISGVSKGALKDWAFIAVESGDDTFGSTLSGWRPYMQEIVMANVLTGEVRRIAHHRSRSPFANYYHMPRVAASWDGSLVTWMSNMGLGSTTGYVDMYGVRIDGASTEPAPTPTPTPTPSPVVATFSNPASGATVSGTVTVSVGATGGSGYTYVVKAGTATIYTGTGSSFSWNTASVANGSVTLTATATSSAGVSGSATRTVTVSNTVAPLAVAFTSPAAGATVAGTVNVAAAATGGTGTGYTYTFKAGTTTLYTGTSASYGWNTTTVPNGSVTLTVTATVSGASVSATRTVTISNTISGTPTTPTTENVVWTSPVKVAVSGNTITKNSGCNGCADAGAVSQQTIASGDGSVTFKTSSSAWLAVGLSNGNAGTTANEIAYALKFSFSYADVREKGVSRTGWAVAAGDTHKIAVEGGVVKFYRNGTLKYTSAVKPTYPLVVDSSIEYMNNSVQGAVITRTATTATPTPTPTPSPTPTPTAPDTENVVWASAVKVAVTGNTITKNTGCDGCWDAGAISQQTIASGASGSVAFAASANAYLSVGLSQGNPGTSANEIDFALRFQPGYIEVRESGIYKADWPFVAGAVNKIAVEGGKVKYYQNGTLKYTSTIAPSYPLLVDTTIGTVGAGIQSATITK